MARNAEQSLVLPGGLVVLAALWIIGAWLVAMGPATPVQPSAATFTPGVRMMLLCVGIGLFVAWPLLRLSQQAPSRPAAHVWLDLVVLLPMMQLVVWLPRVLTVWSVSRTAALAALLSAWVVLVGAIIAAVIGSDRRGPRNLSMVICLLICLLGPAAAWFGVVAVGSDTPSLVRLGPLMGVHVLTDGGSTPPTPAQWSAVIVVAAAAMIAWVALGIRANMSRS